MGPRSPRRSVPGGRSSYWLRWLRPSIFWFRSYGTAALFRAFPRLFCWHSERAMRLILAARRTPCCTAAGQTISEGGENEIHRMDQPGDRGDCGNDHLLTAGTDHETKLKLAFSYSV